jgi:hypothetical protein
MRSGGNNNMEKVKSPFRESPVAAEAVRVAQNIPGALDDFHLAFQKELDITMEDYRERSARGSIHSNNGYGRNRS